MCNEPQTASVAQPPAAETPPTFAKVELMGHVTLVGRLTEEEKFGCKLGRLDVPNADGTWTTVYFGGASVYRITVCTEAVARVLAQKSSPAPVSAWDFPKPAVAAIGQREQSHDRVMPCGHTPEECDCEQPDYDDDYDPDEE